MLSDSGAGVLFIQGETTSGEQSVNKLGRYIWIIHIYLFPRLTDSQTNAAPRHRKTRVRPKSVCGCSQAARCTQAQNRPRPFCRTRIKADLPSSSATAYTLEVGLLDSLIKIVNYIKSGALSFSGTSVS